MSLYTVIKDLHSETTGIVEGKLLHIYGTEYVAWNYDTYIFDACDIAEGWPADEVTYDRIIHLRFWLRENTGHGHDLKIDGLTTAKKAQDFIHSLIDLEYAFSFNDPELQLMKDVSHCYTDQIFSDSP